MSRIMRIPWLLSVILCNALLAGAVMAQPKNIILMIGDGMGPAHMKAYRLYKDNPATQEIETTLFDRYLLGTLRTDPIDPRRPGGQVTDSASSATAYSTGQKTINGMVAQSASGENLETVLQRAKKLGKATGLVSTSEITHATPAAFSAHVPKRSMQDEIADQQFDIQWQGMPMVDVLLGGGMSNYRREDRDLVAEFKGKGYGVVTNAKQLKSTKQAKLLGLFADEGLPEVLERTAETPSLAQMSEAALKKLSANPQGFFLMIEGSQIDWASHDNNVLGMLAEMDDFAAAFATVLDFAERNGETLVLLTADHETGGLTLSRTNYDEDLYFWDADFLRGFNRSLDDLTSELMDSGLPMAAAIEKQLGATLSEDEKNSIGKPDMKDRDATRETLKHWINERSGTGWTTGGHTGVDVNIYGYGPGHEQMRGQQDNTAVGRYIFKLLE